MVARRTRFLAATWAALGLAATAPIVWAQDAEPAPVGALSVPGDTPREGKLANLWENLIHYVRIAQPEAAASFAQSLLSAGAKPSEIYYLSAQTPGSLATLARGRQLKGMEELVDKLLGVVEEGYRVERSDPEQIRKAIELLGGMQREYIRGRDRLVASGEYAVPQVLRALEDPQLTNVMREKIMVVLPQIGKAAVLPLCEALVTANPQVIQIIASTLGRIEYPHALPALMELYGRKDLQEETRRIVRAALVACAGGNARILDKPVAELYYSLALKFYYRAESIVPDVRVETANVWYWDQGLGGLTFKAVPRQIFCDLYAMRMARKTLEHDAQYYPAVSLWLASNVKREADLPQGAADPTRDAEEPPAAFYLLSSGAAYQQDILARALRDNDWPVAIAAIEALGRTSGAESLVKPVAGGAQPLVEALSGSNRLVRYWAAYSLAAALPKDRFTGDELVLPILATAIRATGKQSALVVAGDQERRNVLKDAARALGYEVIDADEPAKGLAAARDAGGADVALLGVEPDPMIGAGLIRRDPLLATLPIVITAQTDRFQALAKDDPRVRLVSPTAGNEDVAKAVTEVVQASAGVPLTPEQAAEWAVRAAGAIRLLGLTRSTVFDVTRVRELLVYAIDDERIEVKIAAAQALATVPGPQAQRGIATLALDAAADEKIRIAAFEALRESVRRFGNSLADDQAQAVVDVVNKGSGDIRTAAAEILGAMSLPSTMIKDLVLQAPGPK